ncbi:hypothetical protein [Methylobacterium currus]|uniref:hypothetical protein n=1 Tax=Methylobacterium currus TaxID=2051553 RepID=UPI000F4E4244|nr:hypothetical protein [Methylobacterium currus]
MRLISIPARVIEDDIPVGMPDIEVAEFLTSLEYKSRLEKLASRRTFVTGILSTGLVTAAPGLSHGQGGAVGGLVNVIVKNPKLAKIAWEVGEYLVGRFISQNKNKSEGQDGSTSLTISAGGRTESSRSITIVVPRSTTITISFDDGPAPRSEGNKNFNVISALNVATTNFRVGG